MKQSNGGRHFQLSIIFRLCNNLAMSICKVYLPLISSLSLQWAINGILVMQSLSSSRKSYVSLYWLPGFKFVFGRWWLCLLWLIFLKIFWNYWSYFTYCFCQYHFFNNPLNISKTKFSQKLLKVNTLILPPTFTPAFVNRNKWIF